MKVDRARELMGRFGRQRILVVGDLMLDRYVIGTVNRISPEAPVPVVVVMMPWRIATLAPAATLG